jgi:hypothetical protein
MKPSQIHAKKPSWQWLARSFATVLDERVFGQSLNPGANPRRAGGLRNSLDATPAAFVITCWNEIRDGAHARSRQAFRPVQSLHESSNGRVVSRVRNRQSVATAKREFGRFVLARRAAAGDDGMGFGMEAGA